MIYASMQCEIAMQVVSINSNKYLELCKHAVRNCGASRLSQQWVTIMSYASIQCEIAMQVLQSIVGKYLELCNHAVQADSGNSG